MVSCACIRFSHNVDNETDQVTVVICIQRCGPSGMFLLSQRASACLILACLSTFFCRPATAFVFDFGMFEFGPYKDAVLPAHLSASASV